MARAEASAQFKKVAAKPQQPYPEQFRRRHLHSKVSPAPHKPCECRVDWRWLQIPQQDKPTEVPTTSTTVADRARDRCRPCPAEPRRTTQSAAAPALRSPGTQEACPRPSRTSPCLEKARRNARSMIETGSHACGERGANRHVRAGHQRSACRDNSGLHSLLNRRQGKMAGIGLRSHGIAPAHGIEARHQLRIRVPRLGSSDLFDAMAVPKSARATERSQPALRGNSRAGHNKKPILCTQIHKANLLIPATPHRSISADHLHRRFQNGADRTRLPGQPAVSETKGPVPSAANPPEPGSAPSSHPGTSQSPAYKHSTPTPEPYP